VALIKCKECQTLISTKAETCPSCGAKPKKRTSLLTWLVLLIILVVAYNTAFTSKPVSNSSQPTVPVASSGLDLPVLPDTPKKSIVQSNWGESSYTDDMTDEAVKVFSLKSKTSVNFEFPYKKAGGSYLNLYIRKGEKTFDAFLQVDKGQMLCGHSNCGFIMRVNNGKAQNWTGLKSSTGEADLMFIRDAKAFEKIAKAGGTVRIGMDFYHSGQQTFDFDLAGYPSK
jgi:RNA polymerase subunit RPABC4/transcription elongation factor Spt4